MDYKRLGLLGVGLALLFWFLALSMRAYLFRLPLSVPSAAAELLILLIAALFFWWWIARRLGRADEARRDQARRLAALHSAGLAITTQHDLASVLQTVVDESRRLLRARYGALGVLDESSAQIDKFIVSGLEPEIYARLHDHPPQGHGLLGIPIHQRRSLRVDNIAAHPASVGFPPHHPPMHTFLGAPIASRNQVFGNLYLTDKLPAVASDRSEPQPFTEEDQKLLEMFATQAAIAIENATLYRQSQEIAVLRERERFGMDLHDGVIQSIYAVGLLLDDGLHHLQSDPEVARERVLEATQRLNTVISDIRRYIHDLRDHSDLDGATNPLAQFEQLARTLRIEAGLDVRLEIDAAALRQFTPRQNAELLQIAREACANVRRHAQATRVEIRLAAHAPGDPPHSRANAASQPLAEQAVLEIRDNGRGFDYPTPDPTPGQGLQNMRARANSLHGAFDVQTAPHQGSTIRIAIPLGRMSQT